MQKCIALISLLVCLATFAFSQDDKSKRPSPPAQADCKLADGKTIHVDYSSPRMHDPKSGELRKIVGGLVPYGKVWRAGANEATSLVTSADLTVSGKNIPAGTYTLFALPTANEWTLIISKTTGEWGTNYSGPGNDLMRVGMDVTKLSSPLENFTISFDQSGGSCAMHLDWESTRASVKFSEKK